MRHFLLMIVDECRKLPCHCCRLGRLKELRHLEALSYQVRVLSQEGKGGRSRMLWPNGSSCHNGCTFCRELFHMYDDRARHNDNKGFEIFAPVCVEPIPARFQTVLVVVSDGG